MNPSSGIVLAVTLGILPGIIAQRKGRCFIDWWLYGMALFAVALVHSLLLQPARTRCIYKGVFLIATGRSEGLEYFGDSSARFLASLASLALWPAIGLAAIAAGSGRPEMAADVMASVCAIVAPPVITYELATRWDRAARWARYATGFNWCQWALPVAGIILITIVGELSRNGLPRDAAVALLVCAFSAYGLWLHWFIAWRGLVISRVRAALLVVLVNAVSVMLVVLPHLLTGVHA
jgi:hypothetical protein